MKNTSIKFTVANIFGAVFLLATAWHFGIPAFGWLITVCIIAVYVVSMERYRRVYLHLDSEENLLEEYRKQQHPEPIGTGVIAERIRSVADLTMRGVQINANVFSEILSARESSTISRSPGGITVLLGLAGTFYGLMLAVSSAGGALDVNNATTTLAAIHGIFSSMKGIFGTSFCGIAGALLLNFTHSIVTSRKLAYMADVEEYTQLQLLPAYAPKGDNTEELRRNALVEQLSKVVSSMQLGMQDQLVKAVESLSKSLETATTSSLDRLEALHKQAAEGLKNSNQDSLARIELSTKSLEGTTKSSLDRLEALHKQASEDLKLSNQDSLSRIESSTKILVEQVGRNTAEAISLQTESAKEQWTTALESVRSTMVQNVEQGKAAVVQVQVVAEQVASNGKQAIESILTVGGKVTEQGKTALDSIQAIAYKVSEQADSRALDLAQNVGSQLEQLSREVQASFGMLASASRELVDSQRVLLDEIEKRQVREGELTESLQSGIGEAGTLMRINQSEFQASLELFRQGIDAILEKFTGGSAEQESQRTFVEQLHATLEAFSEKASEVLVENAMRTQEILLEVLEQARVSGAGSSESSAEKA